jgi:hypothetical protein
MTLLVTNDISYKILTPRFTNFDSAFYKFWLRVLQILTPRFTNFWLRVLQIHSAFYKSTPLRVLQHAVGENVLRRGDEGN